MEKRSYKRISARVDIRYFVGNVVCSGTVTNLSENDMCIKTKMCLPFNSMFKVFILFKEEVLKIPVKVMRVAKTEGYYDTMGVELLNPSKTYFELVDSVRAAYKSFNTCLSSRLLSLYTGSH